MTWNFAPNLYAATRCALACALAGLMHFAPVAARAQAVETVQYSWEDEIPADDETLSYSENEAANDASANADNDAPEYQRLATSPSSIALSGVAPDSAPKQNKSSLSYGPFRVVDGTIAEMDGVVDRQTPIAFAALLRAHPGIKTLRLIECPGTEDDSANFKLAAMVRRAGISTHVPSNGSIRSGGVELFLAGVTRRADPGAELGVHSWQDSDGLEAKDVPANDPVHRRYIDYYISMGMTPERAAEFYAFTNATPSHDVYYMSEADMLRFGLLV